MNAHVLSANIAVPRQWGDRTTGIDKRPAPKLTVAAPGPDYGDGSGVAGDVIGDDKHHGGAQKAVYAFAREELDYWQERLGRTLADGAFGENLTTRGVDVSQLLINQRMRLGTAELEVSVPRSPCRTFADWVGEPGWVRKFTDRGDCGAYFRVVEPGEIRAGDELELIGAPPHGITMGMAFAAKMGDAALARAIMEADILTEMYQQRLVARFT